MKRIFTMLILIGALSLDAFAQTPAGLNRTATSSIKATRDKNGNPLITTINRRFTLVDVPTQPLPGALLLLEEFRREHQPGSEGGKGFVKVDAWLAKTYRTKAWTIEQAGDDGRVFDEFYRVTKYGCCASSATNFFFNLETGRRVFSSTGELFTVIVPNTGLYRYIAYHSNDAIIPPLEPRANDFRGLLQYGTPKTALWKLAIHSKLEPIARIKFQYKNKIVESDSLMLWGADGKKETSSLSQFAIVVSLGSSGDIVLPITNDALDLTQATIPPRYRVEPVK